MPSQRQHLHNAVTREAHSALGRRLKNLNSNFLLARESITPVGGTGLPVYFLTTPCILRVVKELSNTVQASTFLQGRITIFEMQSEFDFCTF
jgi:hypothetical protein